MKFYKNKTDIYMYVYENTNNIVFKNCNNIGIILESFTYIENIYIINSVVNFSMECHSSVNKFIIYNSKISFNSDTNSKILNGKFLNKKNFYLLPTKYKN